MLDRFDIIGFDPRGVARSAPVRCFRTAEEADAVNEGWFSLPRTKDEIASSIRQSKVYTDYCKINAGPLLNHMSTEAVARDLDVMREAVGDKQLNFVGFSYGTLLGSTYANIFPHRTRAMVIDGNVDPQLRLTQRRRVRPPARRRLRDRARRDAPALRLRPVSPSARSPVTPGSKFDDMQVSRWARRRRRCRTAPRSTLADVIGRVAGDLYSIAEVRGARGAWLQSVHNALNPAAAAFGVQSTVDLAAPLNNNAGRADVDPLPDTPYTADDSYYAVNCTDKPFAPHEPQLGSAPRPSGRRSRPRSAATRPRRTC